MVCFHCNYGKHYGQYANEGHGKGCVGSLIASHYRTWVQPFCIEPFIMSDSQEEEEKQQILPQIILPSTSCALSFSLQSSLLL